MPETYRSPHTGTIADLIGRRATAGSTALRASGDAAAQARMASGQAWGNAIQNIGSSVSGTLADFAQYQQDAPNRKLREQQSDLLAKQLSALDTQAAQTEIGRLAEMVKASGYDPGTAEPIFRAIGKLSPDYEQPLMRSLMDPAMLKTVTDTLISQVPGYKAPEGFTLAPGAKRFDATGNELASAPVTPPTPQPFTLGPGQTRFNPDGTQVAAGPPAPEPNKPQPTEASLIAAAASGDPVAVKALELWENFKKATQREPQPPTVRYTPKTVTVNGKTIEANYDAISGKYYDPDSGQQLTGIQTAPTADQRNKESGKKVAGMAVDALKKLGDGLFTKIGPAQRAQAIRRGVDAVFGNDPQFRTYQDARMAAAGALAVEQQGLRVSDADVKSLWLPMIPDVYRDTKDSYDLKWQLINAMRGVESPADPKSVTTPDGQTFTFPTKEAADAFRRSLGGSQ